jgi:A/G-specific adenine glycosylase
MPRYTQGLMDLGATLCLPRNPSCLLCPVQADARAAREGKAEAYPVKTKKLKRSAESLWLLHAQAGDGIGVAAEAADAGVWAGLYCLPVFASREALDEVLPAKAQVRTRRSLSCMC